ARVDRTRTPVYRQRSQHLDAQRVSLGFGPGRSAEPFAFWLVEFQGVSQRPQRLAVWTPGAAPFEIAQRPDADPGPGRQIVLGHPGPGAVPTNELTERGGFELFHVGLDDTDRLTGAG